MGDAANASRRRLGSILLARKARYTDSENETTATAISKVGYTMAVSFWIAEPPQLSLFSINCSKPHELQHSKHTNFRYLPRVVGAEGRFVLFRAAFAEGHGLCEYFLYRAGDAGKSPLLERIPSPYEDDDDGDRDDLRGVREFSILPLRADVLVVALCDDTRSDDYRLRIYSSENHGALGHCTIHLLGSTGLYPTRTLELAQKIKRARNAAGSTIQNDQISQELDNKVLELEREIEQERKQKKEQKLGIPSSVSKID
ncbi:hypothetical protein ZWY2020_001300 [Hordeum vulgare]|nr:hypothetical protein ZWY2020_001300 [Hordeum vulgare]